MRILVCGYTRRDNTPLLSSYIEFLKMFRLLAILVALHFSSKVDGEPSIPSSESETSSAGSSTSAALDKEQMEALSQVKKAKELLSLPGADPYHNEPLAIQLLSAVYMYNKAFNRPELDSYLITFNMKEFRDILEDMNPHKPVESATNNAAEYSQTVMKEVNARAAEKKDAREVVIAAKDALNGQSYPFSDARTAELIEKAIPKYNKAYGRRKLKLAQGQDEAYHNKQKLDELNTIFEHMEKHDKFQSHMFGRDAALKHRKDNSNSYSVYE